MTVVTSGAYEAIRQQALVRIERERLDPSGDPERVRAVVSEEVSGWQRRAHLGEGVALRDPADMAARVLRSITDYGALSELFARDDVEEVFVEGDRVTYIDATGRLQGLTVPTTEEENRQVVDRLLATTERHLDTASPLVQARVLDGTARLSAAIPPVADRLSATIRRHTLRRDTLASLVERGSLTPTAAGLLHAAMQTSASVLVSGPPGAGKTSLLAALLAAAPASHCIRCCEEIRELAVPLTHGSFYETRPPGLDGAAEITLRDLVKFVLAMRPDRIVVGEARGAEAFRWQPSLSHWSLPEPVGDRVDARCRRGILLPSDILLVKGGTECPEGTLDTLVRLRTALLTEPLYQVTMLQFHDGCPDNALVGSHSAGYISQGEDRVAEPPDGGAHLEHVGVAQQVMASLPYIVWRHARNKGVVHGPWTINRVPLRVAGPAEA